MLRLVAPALALLLLTIPTAAADHEGSNCGWNLPAIDLAQCIANLGIDTAEHLAQDGIGEVCMILFGEPC